MEIMHEHFSQLDAFLILQGHENVQYLYAFRYQNGVGSGVSKSLASVRHHFTPTEMTSILP